MSDRQLLSATLQAHVRMGSVRSSRAEINNAAEDRLTIQRAHRTDSSPTRNTDDNPKERASPPVSTSSAEISSANSSGSSPVIDHASEIQVPQLAEPLEYVHTAKSADQTTPICKSAENLCPSSTTPPISTSLSSTSSISHFGDSNMSDTSWTDSAASGSTPTPPDTASTLCRSNHKNYPPTAASETRTAHPKSPPLLPSWIKLSNRCPHVRSRNPTTEIKKIDCSYKNVSHRQVAKKRDLIETHGEDEDEVGILDALTHEPQDHTRAMRLWTRKFAPTNNKTDDDEKQFMQIPRTRSKIIFLANGTPPDSSSSHHQHLLQKDLQLEPFPNLGRNTSRAILADGYTPQHFALFLQILYGIQSASTLKDSNLLPVFCIAHVYELSWLVSLLGAQVYQRLTLSAET
ncbi:hypothetical protein BGZ92_006900 [Podila epicladia]|nr:hypothetical protein BGZ92_006900 [Podila epicladia]